MSVRAACGRRISPLRRSPGRYRTAAATAVLAITLALVGVAPIGSAAASPAGAAPGAAPVPLGPDLYTNLEVSTTTPVVSAGTRISFRVLGTGADGGTVDLTVGSAFTICTEDPAVSVCPAGSPPAASIWSIDDAGEYTMTATVFDDGIFLSAGTNIVVTPQPTLVSPAAMTYPAGTPVTLAADVTFSPADLDPPSGTVYFQLDYCPVTGSGSIDCSTAGVTQPGPGQCDEDCSSVPSSTAVTLRGGLYLLTVEFDPSSEDAGSYSASTSTGALNLTPLGPTITAAVSSSAPRSSFGWYRTPVTVTFICVPGSAPLVPSPSRPDGCPGPVGLTASAKDQTVSRTVTAADGGTAAVTTGDIDIDRIPPTVHAGGVTNGRTYPHPLKLRCVAHDGLSGVASCRVTTTDDDGVIHYTATAYDRAGNRAARSGHYILG